MRLPRTRRRPIRGRIPAFDASVAVVDAAIAQSLKRFRNSPLSVACGLLASHSAAR
jgi:hypothetical protein